MIFSLASLIMTGLILGYLMHRLRLPRLIGFLITGLLLGPYAFNLVDESILSISTQLRQIALIIILIRAGLSLNKEEMKAAGPTTLLLSFLPASFEILGYTLLAPRLLGLTYAESLLLGSVISAVSPAVVVPKMIYLMDHGYGQKNQLPATILAASSLDDIFVITLFTSFLTMGSQGFQWVSMLNIPLSIFFAFLLSWALASLLGRAAGRVFTEEDLTTSPYTAIILFAISLFLFHMETALENIIPLSGLLAVLLFALFIKTKFVRSFQEEQKLYFSNIWLFAEILLFTLVGSAVDIRYTLGAGLAAVLLLFLGLVFRGLGVFLALVPSPFSFKEKLFIQLAYLPKATVQAAIGSVPLAYGIDAGPIILSMAVISILITAPLGAIAMDKTYRLLLEK